MIRRSKESSRSRVSKRGGAAYTETISFKNVSRKDSIADVMFVYYDAISGASKQQSLTSLLAPGKSVKVDFVKNGRQIRITSFQCLWTYDDAQVKGSYKTTTPGYFLLKLSASVKADGSNEIYLFTQHSF
jgi:hypothetical protein